MIIGSVEMPASHMLESRPLKFDEIDFANFLFFFAGNISQIEKERTACAHKIDNYLCNYSWHHILNHFNETH